jgi:cytochrome c biogenesis protein
LFASTVSRVRSLGLYLMSAVEESKNQIVVGEKRPSNSAPVNGAFASAANRMLETLSSVRFGIILLIILVVLSMIGMVIMQQEVSGFDEYYATLTPSEKLLAGSLGFFDIYHTWYFNLLLIILSLNIVLASIDRFPKAWTFLARPKLDASARWLQGQKPSETFTIEGANRPTVAAQIAEACRAEGLKPTVTEKTGKTFVFAERGAWNRLGAYAVHVALLTIFIGGFLSSHFGRTGQMQLQPGSSATAMTLLQFNLDQVARVNARLPFTVLCTDIEQKLMRREEGIDAGNTLDWLTRIRIRDETGEHEALVSLNNPYDYRGYRFFQAQTIAQGMARNITLRVEPENGGEAQTVNIRRDGSATLADGTRIDFINFFADFVIEGNQIGTRSSEYRNPTAQLAVTPPQGQRRNAFAFSDAVPIPEGAPIGAAVAGYRFRLADFEKVPLAHILSIKYDPFRGSFIAFYIGGTLLILTLCAVFFFSHQRVWAVIEERGGGDFEIVMGGNTNRNQMSLEDRFKKIIERIKSV